MDGKTERKGALHIKCAVYCRLSKEDAVFAQDHLRAAESESIQNQKSLLCGYAEEMGWEIWRVYSDEDYSGADRERPEFNRLIRDAENKCFGIVLCKTQSRFTRDMELVEKYIHNLFPLWGIRFIALVDHADTEIKGNKKARQINGLVNEWYLEDLSENIRAVLDHKRRNGRFIGSFAVYGYRKDPKDHNRLEIDEEAAETVRWIFRMACEGYGRQKIADRLNREGIPNPTKYKGGKGSSYVNGMAPDNSGLWSRSTVGRILRNETYIGTLVQGKRQKINYKSAKLRDIPSCEWIRVQGTHEPIIEEKVFQAAQEQMRLRSMRCGSIHESDGGFRENDAVQ